MGTGAEAYWIMQAPRSISQLRPRTRFTWPSSSSQMRKGVKTHSGCQDSTHSCGMAEVGEE